MQYSSSFRKSLEIQLRVIGALLMREVITRFGRNNIGFLWLFLEPIIFTVGVIVLWSLLHTLSGFRVDITPFAVTGYSTLLLWRNCSFRGLRAIEPNRSLLHHRNVQVIDIFASRMLLEVAGVTASTALVSAVLLALGLMVLPKDPFLMLTGWIMISWFSATLGIILGCLSEHTDLIERMWHPVSYFMLSVSGAFFLVDWLPSDFREIVLWVPMVHATEMLRLGYFGPITPVYYDLSYIFAICMLMTLISLLLIRDVRLRNESAR